MDLAFEDFDKELHFYFLRVSQLTRNIDRIKLFFLNERRSARFYKSSEKERPKYTPVQHGSTRNNL